MALLSPSFIFSTFFYSILFSSSVFAGNNTQKGIQEHFSALLHLKHGFNFSEKASTNLSSWDLNDTDCCVWGGIGCDGDNSHVISIDLSNRRISGRIDFESLFRLQSLQSLNLASNYFNPSPFSPGFNQNLSSLRELSLDWINISMQGSEWVQALFLSVPHLRDLSLRYCGLSGPIHSSLSKLHFLKSKLDLSNNNLSGSLPSFLVNLSKLEYLDLSFNSFSGPIPSSYGNEFRNKLGGGLDVIHNASSSQLEYIYLGNNYLQGMVSFIFKLVKLSSISLPFNNFSGVVEVGSFQTLKSLFSLSFR
ncbi:receptor-like protein 48 [Magnolia sinica]|uniref:receptor-like protein 48 n=1 Tax=Magnolia sinica TaxID=86752 RepID=UPI0026583FEB|nr:receptor-like protein 48 [Magnolia sinica]